MRTWKYNEGGYNEEFKLFRNEEGQQVVAKLDKTESDNVEVRFYDYDERDRKDLCGECYLVLDSTDVGGKNDAYKTLEELFEGIEDGSNY